MVYEASKYIKKCLGGGEDDALMFCGQGTTSAIKRLQEVMGIAVPSILRERVINTLFLENHDRFAFPNPLCTVILHTFSKSLPYLSICHSRSYTIHLICSYDFAAAREPY